MTRTYTAVVHKEDEWYVAECPEIGTASQGSSIEEAIANLQEATSLYLEEFPTSGSPRPFYDPNHPIRNHLETFDSVEEVRIIREALKK